MISAESQTSMTAIDLPCSTEGDTFNPLVLGSNPRGVTTRKQSHINETGRLEACRLLAFLGDCAKTDAKTNRKPLYSDVYHCRGSPGGTES